MTPTQPPSAMPVQKVVSGALAGALSTILVYILDHAFQGQFMITGEVASAITVILTFVVSYLTPPAGVGSAPASTPLGQQVTQGPQGIDLNQLMTGVVQAALAGVAHGTASAQQPVTQGGSGAAAQALAAALQPGSGVPGAPPPVSSPTPGPTPIKPLGMQP